MITCANAILVSALVGAVCGFLSAYLMLKGWSLIGDALSHAIVPGVAGAYMLGLPFAFGAFLSGGLAALAILFLNQRTKLKEDAIIGLIFTSFFGLGLFMVSISPVSIDIKTIVLGNILAITPADTLQLVLIGGVSLLVLTLKWKDLMVTFFDENHAPFDWTETRAAKGDLLHPISGLNRCRHADRRRLPRHRHGRHPPAPQPIC